MHSRDDPYVAERLPKIGENSEFPEYFKFYEYLLIEYFQHTLEKQTIGGIVFRLLSKYFVTFTFV